MSEVRSNSSTVKNNQQEEEGCMAEVIEFYVPKDFRQQITCGAWRRGKLIEFRLAINSVMDDRAIQSDTSEGDHRTPALHVTSL